LGLVSSAGAVTIDFTGASSGTPLVLRDYQFDYARIVNGNCNIKPYLALNPTETSVLTRVDGGTFTLSSIWFQLLGKAGGDDDEKEKKEKKEKKDKSAVAVEKELNGLLITSTGPAGSIRLGQDPADGGYDHNKPYTYLFGDLFKNVTSIIFTSYDGGNVRIDDLVVTSPPPAAVPLPAAGGLLLAAMAGMGMLRRRRSTLA
jgi:hypothetical protein